MQHGSSGESLSQSVFVGDPVLVMKLWKKKNNKELFINTADFACEERQVYRHSTIQHLAQGHFDVQLGDPEIEPPTYQLMGTLSHSLPPIVTTESDVVHTEKW